MFRVCYSLCGLLFVFAVCSDCGKSLLIVVRYLLFGVCSCGLLLCAVCCLWLVVCCLLIGVV